MASNGSSIQTQAGKDITYSQQAIRVQTTTEQGGTQTTVTDSPEAVSTTHTSAGVSLNKTREDKGVVITFRLSLKGGVGGTPYQFTS